MGWVMAGVARRRGRGSSRVDTQKCPKVVLDTMNKL